MIPKTLLTKTTALLTAGGLAAVVFLSCSGGGGNGGGTNAPIIGLTVFPKTAKIDINVTQLGADFPHFKLIQLFQQGQLAKFSRRSK